MPTTSNFGWTTPADTDLVKDGAAAIRTLGNGIDTSLVDLKGGTTGQVLSKNSNTDLDYTWVTPNVGDITEVQAGTGISVASGTGPIPVVTNTVATAYDAKGDLIVGTGADTFAKLTVGTNGHTLVADSATATGLKWAAASSTPTFVGCAAISTSATNVGNNTWTAVAFQSERFDTDSFHDNSTNNSRITIPAGKGGYYLVIYRSGFESITTNDCIMKLYKNGSVFDEGYTYSTISKVSSPYIKADMHSSAIVSLAAGDYIQLYVLQASGGSSDTWGENRFSVQFLGA